MSGAAAWAAAIQALSLFAADPIGLGGISLRAGAGPVRDRWLKILYDSLPPDMPVRRVPLNAGDDRLLGGLDLAATLQAGRLIEQKGLLSEADGGVIILAMAERIESGAAARLRSVFDEGVVTLQRDGLSRVLPAKFAMVALDEGADPDERPPASLLDRMAFLVALTNVSLRDIEFDDWTGKESLKARRHTRAAKKLGIPAATADERLAPAVMVGEGLVSSVMAGEGLAPVVMAGLRPP